MINWNNLRVVYGYFSIHKVDRRVNRCWFFDFYLGAFSGFGNLSELKLARPFVTRIIWPIASAIVSGSEVPLILTITCTKSNFNFSFKALGKGKWHVFEKRIKAENKTTKKAKENKQTNKQKNRHNTIGWIGLFHHTHLNS